MGFNNTEHWIYLLESGDVVVTSAGGGLPVKSDGPGPWAEAWPDATQRLKASHGVAQMVRNTLRDPGGVNYVDFLRPIYKGVLFGPYDQFYYAEGAANTQSGNRSLHIRDVTAVTDRDARGPVFRLHAGQSYRFSVKWKSSTAHASLITFGVDQFKGDFSFATGAFTGLLTGTNGSWQWDSFVFTADSTARFGTARVNMPWTVTRGDIYIDEILIEPIGGLVHRTTIAGQTIATDTETAIEFENEITGAGTEISVTAGGALFAVLRPGDYQICANLLFAALTDATRYGIKIAAAGQNYWGGHYVVGGANFGGAHVSAVCRLARQDTITIRAYQLSGSNKVLHLDGSFNYVTIKRLD